jgi:hypothetical protein
MATVLHLFRAPRRRLSMEELAEIRALEDSGLDGCAHARTGSPRQVLLMDSETLELMESAAGHHPGKYHHSGNQREWARCGAAPSCWGGATGNQRSMHALRFA